ncbi:hypothetical protein RUM44_013415 [Polyplax serrata]|uniref:Uncharacterized protein n=1 Tax=Polyplax serrata TaxID=468196 RepID=A0ABR1BE50_POLSC
MHSRENSPFVHSAEISGKIFWKREPILMVDPVDIARRYRDVSRVIFQVCGKDHAEELNIGHLVVHMVYTCTFTCLASAESFLHLNVNDEKKTSGMIDVAK